MRDHLEGQRPGGADPLPEGVQRLGKYARREGGLRASCELIVVAAPDGPHEAEFGEWGFERIFGSTDEGRGRRRIRSQEAFDVAAHRRLGCLGPSARCGKL